MKNQYFGDQNDYIKYGLLRSLLGSCDLRLLVVWMLTPDDGGPDGNKTSYLSQEEEWGKNDPVLFEKLSHFIEEQHSRDVKNIEGSDLLPRTSYFSEVVPVKSEYRDEWFQGLMSELADTDIVFFDPDNGLEVKSCPYGSANSDKYLFRTHFHHRIPSLFISSPST